MDKESPYAKSYKHMKDVTDDRGIHEITLSFATAKDEDMRRYNHPNTLEASVIFEGNEGEPPGIKDIVVWTHEYATHRVSELSEHVDPLAYPLLFPWGEPGWHPQLKHRIVSRTTSYTRVTPIQFYACRLMIRKNLEGKDTSLLPHGAGLLFQQYVCDVYSRVEGQRLNWYRLNQKNLRVELYDGLSDALQKPKFDLEKPLLGTRVILPSSYPGCPRNMQQNYCDALALVGRYGKPDYFTPMTANPSWIEIVDNLRPGETSQGRPDLMARVFHLKFKELLRQLLDDNVLGRVVSYTWVIEFQKRGLPHAHILLIMASAYKPKTPEDIDARICAEYQDPRLQPELHQIILRSQTHGPCGQTFNHHACSMERARRNTRTTLSSILSSKAMGIRSIAAESLRRLLPRACT